MAYNLGICSLEEAGNDDDCSEALKYFDIPCKQGMPKEKADAYFYKGLTYFKTKDYTGTCDPVISAINSLNSFTRES